MHFDAVLDSNMNPIFNGTPDDTYEWLADAVNNGLASEEWRVCLGVSLSLVTVEEYQRKGK